MTRAALPPPGLPGLDPAWSRLVTDARGHTWHVLDHGAAGARHVGVRPWQPDVVVSLAAVRRGRAAGLAGGGRRPARHGVLAAGSGADARRPRRRPGRRAHRARRHRPGGDRGARLGRRGLAGLGGASPLPGCAVVLANTAVHQPAGAAAPSLIRLARTPALRHAACAATPAFVRATTALSRPALPAKVRDAFAAPYGVGGSAAGRRGVRRGHPARAGARQRRDPRRDRREVRKLDDVPALLLWGPRDPVFSDRYLRDLRARLPARRRPALRAGVAPRPGGRPGGRRRRVGLDRRRSPRPATAAPSAEPDARTRTAARTTCRLAAANVPTRGGERATARRRTAHRTSGPRSRHAPATPPPPSSSPAAGRSRGTCSSGGCTSWPSGSPSTGWPRATGSRCSSRPARP